MPEAPRDPQEQLEYGAKWALKDHRERKEQLETKERGVRKDTEVSLDSTVCQEQLAPQESQELWVLLDQLGRGVLQECRVLQERKETSVILDQWDLLEAEEPSGSSESRVHKVSPDHLALQDPQDLPPQLWKTSSFPLTIMT